MNKLVLKQIVTILAHSKSDFTFTVTGHDASIEYNINSGDITARIIGREAEYVTNCNLETLPLIEGSPKVLIERRYNYGKLIKENKEFFFREVELFIAIFKIMGENVKFLYSHNGKDIVCYYINNRVFFITETSDTVETNDLNLISLYSLFKGGCIKIISNLPKKYWVKDFYTEFDNYSKRVGKRYKNIKRGVLVNDKCK